jgi:hypothetical protein
MGSLSPGVKLTTHLHLVPRLRKLGDYTSTTPYVSMACCLVVFCLKVIGCEGVNWNQLAQVRDEWLALAFKLTNLLAS